MRRPLGCLTGAGVIAALVTLLVVSGVTLATGGGWFSPGSLNAAGGGEPYGGVTSHAETGGDCAACHPAPWARDTMADRCAGCHTALQDSDSHLAEFHRLLRGDNLEQPCRTCHPEHRGQQAALTVVSSANFPHDATGFSLRAHSELNDRAFACSDCHGAGFTAFEVATCDRCHADRDPAYMAVHRQDFGTGCLGCHDGVDRFGGFDHAATAFPLQGAHASLACSECHVARTPADFGHATACSGCHAEPAYHQGLFGADCSACHAATGWLPARYDEAHTFPINHGEQRASPCRTCHPDELTAYTCYGCHEHTPEKVRAEHEGEVTGEIMDCVRCHPTGQKEGGEESRGGGRAGEAGDDGGDD